MQRIITGSGGFIGSRLLKRVGGLGLDSKQAGNLLYCELPKEADVIFHLAAHKSVEESWIHPLLYLENLAITMRLVHTYPTAKIIHASSCAADTPDTSPYGFLKKAASEYLRLYNKNAVNLYLPNIFGGQQRQNSVVDIFKSSPEVTVHGDGGVVRDYVHVDDVVDAFIKAQEWAPGDYYIGTGIGHSVMELAIATGKKIHHAPPRSGGREPRESIVPNTTPNWKPTIDVMQYLCA